MVDVCERLLADEMSGSGFEFGWEQCHQAGTVQGKCQLLHPATPYYPFPRGKFHTMGNIWSFTVG